MNDYNEGSKTIGESGKVGNELPLCNGVCKCHKWVEIANKTKLKPIILYTWWYFSRRVKKILKGKTKFEALRATIKIIYPPYTIVIMPHFFLILKQCKKLNFWWNFSPEFSKWRKFGRDMTTENIILFLRKNSRINSRENIQF